MRSRLYGKLGDRAFTALLVVLGLAVILVAVLLAWELASGGAEAFRTFGFWGFAAGSAWNAVAGQFGAWPFLLGTVITSAAALTLAFLPALASAIAVAEYAPRWLAEVVAYLIDLLAALPSVVYGLWGIFVLVPLVRDHVEQPLFLWSAEHAPALLGVLGPPTGIGMLSAVLVLALMIVPYASSLARDAIRMVPRDQREAMYALGATRWEVVRRVVLPYARGGIFAGVVLALARAIGETMAVTMLIGNSGQLPYSVFGPAATMASLIANEFAEAEGGLQLSSLLAVGFLLLLLSLAVNLVADFILRRMSVGEGRK
ncbi:phosphate ABC transporter membrane protein 1, PhoT family [Oceanithermus profundus DSM 14977]|uniref:Phosphate transport system permease protein n=1 Tax=Oceanithermus profundus (strain DSM 14977 / NBRC 100410 / VKM B-2274 / 506) TaxID=670487 RepID=E4U9X2_OCEP5|nr:phosphate ABC transporter permease subunit PstC [Oceanithermus profundus]ADR37286.1 phosphate ABC transporter membrane protein 1, PhoT family [Oceanithermus profundus DSM 14977]